MQRCPAWWTFSRVDCRCRNLATQIAEAIESAINPLGVGVVIEARHLCMMMRGVEKQHSSTITSSMLPVFREKETETSFSRSFGQETARFSSEITNFRCRTGRNGDSNGPITKMGSRDLYWSVNQNAFKRRFSNT